MHRTLSPRLLATEFQVNPRPVHVGFVADTSALRHVFFRVLPIFLVSVIPSMLRAHSFLPQRRYTVLAVDSVGK